MTKSSDIRTDAPDLRTSVPRSDGSPVAIDPNAQTLFFVHAAAHAVFHGVANIPLTVTRVGVGADGKLAIDEVTVAYLRATLPALKSLRFCIDALLRAAEPSQAGEVIN